MDVLGSKRTPSSPLYLGSMKSNIGYPFHYVDLLIFFPDLFVLGTWKEQAVWFPS